MRSEPTITGPRQETRSRRSCSTTSRGDRGAGGSHDELGHPERCRSGWAPGSGPAGDHPLPEPATRRGARLGSDAVPRAGTARPEKDQAGRDLADGGKDGVARSGCARHWRDRSGHGKQAGGPAQRAQRDLGWMGRHATSSSSSTSPRAWNGKLGDTSALRERPSPGRGLSPAAAGRAIRLHCYWQATQCSD